VFNPLAPSEMVIAVGRVLKEEADAEGERDGYRRGQLLSGYSVARHLAAEQAGAAELRGWFRARVANALEEGDGERFGVRAARLRSSDDAAEIGDLLCGVLADLRAGGETDADTRRRIQAICRELTDREIAVLSDPPA
jgi:hypothetical protein